MMKRKIILGVIALALLTPLGLLARGSTWGEWRVSEVKSLVGYVPEGMRSMASLWSAPLRDYAVPGWQTGSGSVLGYIFSSLVGVALILLIFKAFSYFSDDDSGGDGSHDNP